ncbi:MAG TPA: hypothetical protein VHA52_06820 [Candidatus Babeliaceae bacterium]|nr:hypothetical protein [Candidatus Babeliaceae bacterium]
MKIKCIEDTGKSLPEDLFEPGSGYNKQTRFYLELEKLYTVYGMTTNLGYVWYYICDENFTDYPRWHPPQLFEVADNRISQYWIFSFERGYSRNTTSSNWLYPEWSIDPYDYYDKLSDGCKKQVETFFFYKELMGLEFPDISIPKTQTVLIGNEPGWLICYLCYEAWICNSQFGMIRCPECKNLLHNPFYIETVTFSIK